ncbi:MAG: NAD-dependent DNA ligase LigA [Patescibacteria group bacterium]
MTLKEARERIEKLKELINKYRSSRLNFDRPLISESVEDSLKKELFDLEQEFPGLITPDSPTQRVGGRPLKEFPKVSHPYPMLSFNDAFDVADMEAWQDRLRRMVVNADQGGYFCELKIDGLAIELLYRDGFLVSGSTRGNGVVGEDVTQNLKTVKDIPLFVMSKEIGGKLKGDIIVRGEIFMARKVFQEVNREQEKKGLKIYANPRNLAAGSVRQLDPAITALRKLNSYAYALKSDLGQKTHDQEHLILETLGFKINPHTRLCPALKEVHEFKDKWGKERIKLDYEIDGIVVQVNDNRMFERLGVIGKSPRGAVAYKFSPKEAETVVKNIITQVGRTGTLTPVAVLKPVQIGGVMVSRATLHNLDEIRRLDVRIGDTVIVGRAGDVIPDVKKVLIDLRTGKEKKFHMPRKCLVCREPIEKVPGQVAYRCVNKDCPAIRREAIYHFVSKKALDIDGIGPKVIDQLMDAGLIQDAAQLFELKREDLLNLERFADKSAENAINAIQHKKKVSLSKFIYALGIPHVGEETGFVLARRFKKLGNIAKSSLEELQNAPDVGPIVAQSILGWFQKTYCRELIKKFKKAGVQILDEKTTKKSSKLEGKTFVITGTFESMSREEAKQKIRQLGGDVSSDVSKNADYVVAGLKPGSKYEKAGKLGIKMISEKEFLAMIK